MRDLQGVIHRHNRLFAADRLFRCSRGYRGRNKPANGMPPAINIAFLSETMSVDGAAQEVVCCILRSFVMLALKVLHDADEHTFAQRRFVLFDDFVQSVDVFFVVVCDGIKSFKVNDELLNLGKCVLFVVLKPSPESFHRCQRLR